MYFAGTTVYLKIAQQPMQQLKFGWTEISGDFFTPNGKLISSYLTILELFQYAVFICH